MKFIKRAIKSALQKRGYYIVGNKSLHGDPLQFGGIIFSRKLHQWDFFYERIKGIDGAVIESGIWWGYGLLAHLRYNQGRKIYGFDSFSGHSAPHPKDLAGNFAAPGSSFTITEADVWKTLEMGTEKPVEELRRTIEIVPGWLQKTMPAFISAHKDLKIALIHCDPDLYEPIYVTLTSCWGNLVRGGIVIIGRLNNPEYMGKTEAVKEFTSNLPQSAYQLQSVKIRELETYAMHDLYYLTKL